MPHVIDVNMKPHVSANGSVILAVKVTDGTACVLPAVKSHFSVTLVC